MTSNDLTNRRQSKVQIADEPRRMQVETCIVLLGLRAKLSEEDRLLKTSY